MERKINMKSKKMIPLILVVLICLTAVLAIIYNTTRDEIPEGALLIRYEDQKYYVRPDTLPLSEISGRIRNGKGEEMEIQTQGVPVSDVLKAAGIDCGAIQSATVSADDSYSADLSAEEINETGLVFLAGDGNGGMKLIVFGDSSSRRNVRDVVEIHVK